MSRVRIIDRNVYGVVAEEPRHPKELYTIWVEDGSEGGHLVATGACNLEFIPEQKEE